MFVNNARHSFDNSKSSFNKFNLHNYIIFWHSLLPKHDRKPSTR